MQSEQIRPQIVIRTGLGRGEGPFDIVDAVIVTIQ